MARNISSVDYERGRYINTLMDDLYSHLPNIYETLVDKDIDNARCEIKALIQKLKGLQDSMEDEL